MARGSSAIPLLEKKGQDDDLLVLAKPNRRASRLEIRWLAVLVLLTLSVGMNIALVTRPLPDSSKYQVSKYGKASLSDLFVSDTGNSGPSRRPCTSL